MNVYRKACAILISLLLAPALLLSCGAGSPESSETRKTAGERTYASETQTKEQENSRASEEKPTESTEATETTRTTRTTETTETTETAEIKTRPTETSSDPASPSISESEEPEPTATEDGRILAVYLGIDRYGAEGVDKNAKETFLYRFFVSGEEKLFSIDGKDENGVPTYALQNRLEEGKLFLLTEENGTVTDLERASSNALVSGTVEKTPDGRTLLDGKEADLSSEKLLRVSVFAGGATVFEDDAKDGDLLCLTGENEGFLMPSPNVYIPPVAAAPGERTLKNLLATALSPVGSVLYVYGGGWDWQDEGSSVQSRTIGLSPSWIDFFASQNASYDYKSEDPAKSFYPFGGFNEYFWAGLDCSGYMGWVIYNTVNSESGREGFVGGSTGFAKKLADAGFGTFEHDPYADGKIDLLPGDVVSIKGHVYIVLGVCPDGSVLICHSTVNVGKGSGVQISGIGESEDCDAHRLAKSYMKKFFPAWSERYEAALKSPSVYFDFSAEKAGRFRPHLDGSFLTDPDGFARLSAEEILSLLFA